MTKTTTTVCCCLALIAALRGIVAAASSTREPMPWILPFSFSSESNNNNPLIGYPGVLSREYVKSVIEQEMRNQISLWTDTTTYANASAAGINPKPTLQPRRNNGISRPEEEEEDGGRRQEGGHRSLAAKKKKKKKKKSRDDFDGLNDILETFEFDIPEQVIEQPFLGATATFVIGGQCKDIKLDEITLDYDSKGDDLTYKIEVDDVDVDCILDVEFDFGIYDVEDQLEIDVKLGNNDFTISVVLEGKPPESSSFEGCEAEINIQDIDADGGFSANILNDLDSQLVGLVEQEKPIISQLLCEQLTQFTSVVDGILMTLGDAIEPYLGEPKSVDPLQLEKSLEIDEDLLDFTDSDLGYAIQVITENLEGVFGPYQVNTLIELNLLDEDGLFTLVLTEDEEDESDNDDDSDDDDHRMFRRNLQQSSSLFEECALFRRERGLRRRNLFSILIGEKDYSTSLIGRRMQFDDGFFTVNSLDILTIEVAGLNTFDDVDLLEIIGQYTFRTKLEVSRITVKVTLRLDADINEENIVETIEVNLPIEDIEITASYLIGLSASAVEEIELATLLFNTDNLVPCALSTLRVAGLSELDVSVGKIGIPTVEGVLASGVDELINTATEAAIHHYQDLIVEEAIPNIAQKNVTVQFNEFAECFIRTEAAAAVCPEPEPAEEDTTIIDGLFDFRRLAETVFG